MKAPSTQWKEEIAPDEAERFTRNASLLSEIQKQRSQKFGNGRTFHRRQVLGLRATLEVLPGLPEHACQGLFATPGRYPALVRLSNGSFDIQADAKPDIRGFSIKVTGVSGAKAVGDGPATSQDFLLINREAFSSPKSGPFIDFVAQAAKGPRQLFSFWVKQYGFFAAIGRLRALAKGSPFSGFASQHFFSAAPIACGPFAARVRLLPASNTASATTDWAADFKTRLAQAPLIHELQLQFFVDEATTPIEDASRNWREEDAPYLTVAKLVIAQQAFAGDEAKALAMAIEEARFDPWNALAAHRPLGDVMRARKVAYATSQQVRHACPVIAHGK